MNPSQVTSDHLRRKAVLYVRQSSPHQVREHRESTARQYALQQRALGLGWRSDQVLVIDEDQALSGASADGRHGFQRLVADVGLGEVGIVMGLEVQRLARNNADWHRLLEICALADTFILDEDGIYDPSHFNDRLLLGLKGAISEAELHMLRSRLLGGKLNKARRGELRVPLPVGLVYDGDGQVVLDPDREVQGAVREVFRTFRRTGSAFAVERHFAQEGLLFPKRLRSGARAGEVAWTPLLHERVLDILHNPRYAGAYVYGCTRTRHRGSGGISQRRRLRRDEWQVFIPDAHPGYITWQEYEDNLARLRVNSSVYGFRDGRPSPPREGLALLQGLVLCGRCGGRLSVSYRVRGNGLSATYVCKRRDPETAKRYCQSIAATQLDQAVGQLVVQAVTPTSLDVTLQVFDELRARQAEVDQLRRAQVERARLEAQRAERQFMLVDPENRLVADTLERQWEEKLRAVALAEEEYNRWASEQPLDLSAETRERILKLVEDFPGLWKDPRTPHRERKRMLRLMIEDITLTKGESLRAQIRWKGGATTALELPLLGGGQLRRTPEEVLRQIAHLSANHTDAEIASALNGQGMVSGTGQPFTAELVRGIRRAHAIKGLRARLRQLGWMTAEELARQLQVSLSTIRDWREAGRLNARRCDGRRYLYEDPGDRAPKKRQGRRLGQRV